jgi:hypothetical protein
VSSVERNRDWGARSKKHQRYSDATPDFVFIPILFLDRSFHDALTGATSRRSPQ